MSEELKPCPFCGGEAELKEYKPNVSGVAICKECGARSPICKNDHTGGWKPKAIAEWNTRAELGNGMLTAEQVMAIARKHQPDYCSDTHICFDWQAIADELNATLVSMDKGEPQGTDGNLDQSQIDWLRYMPNGWDGTPPKLGGGECEWELEHSGTLYDKWRCSECKFLFVEPRCDQGYTDLVPNFCPNCGKAVKR